MRSKRPDNEIRDQINLVKIEIEREKTEGLPDIAIFMDQEYYDGLEFSFGKSLEKIKTELDRAYNMLRKIERDVPPGSGAWRLQKRYIDALHWCIGEE